jgi:carbonic anhydrase
MAKMSNENPSLLRHFAREGEREFTTLRILELNMINRPFPSGPPFMLIDCSDSRVNEHEILSAPPGTLFTASNIANIFDETNLNTYAFFRTWLTRIFSKYELP